MIEIRYNEHYEVADLVGRSVAEAREQYKMVFDIPDKARALLNDTELKPMLEPETILKDGDQLSFEVKKRSRKLILAGVLIAALSITGGWFAFTWTTASTTIGATGDSDYAAVEPSSPALTFSTNIFGKWRGTIPTGYLFEITPDSDYTGDMTVNVYLTNVQGLSKAYQHLNLKLELWDSAGTPVNMFASSTGHTFQLLTLDNGTVSFPLDQSTGTSPFKVKLAGGGFMTHGRNPLDWATNYDVEPLLFAEVVQR